MFLDRTKRFLIKYQTPLTYLSIGVSAFLLGKLLYDEIIINHNNPVILFILVGILILGIVSSIINRRNQFLAHLILESSDYINLYALDMNYRFIAINARDIELMESVFKYTPKIGKSPMMDLSREDASRLKANIDRAQKGEAFTAIDVIDNNGKTLYWQNLYSPIYNYRNKIIGTFCIVLDVTEQKEQELEMQKMAYEDVLTQVHNRRYIEIAFNEQMLTKREQLTVIVSDLDKFKEANDTYGHACGDQILIEYGDLLTKIMPKDAVVARLGGDEFAILLPNVSERQAKILVDLIKLEMKVKAMPVTASLGYHTDSYESRKTFADFCALADKKMYQDKNQKG
nr:GGDEF domain-containing protein [Streptococcus lutetiensis]